MTTKLYQVTLRGGNCSHPWISNHQVRVSSVVAKDPTGAYETARSFAEGTGHETGEDLALDTIKLIAEEAVLPLGGTHLLFEKEC